MFCTNHLESKVSNFNDLSFFDRNHHLGKNEGKNSIIIHSNLLIFTKHDKSLFLQPLMSPKLISGDPCVL